MVRDIIQECSILTATKILGKKWTVFVLCELLSKKELYFSDLQNQIKDKFRKNISARVLTDVLTNLEENGIISRQVKLKTTPIRVCYSLTEKGQDFEGILIMLKAWGKKWGGGLKSKICESENCVHDIVPTLDLSSVLDFKISLLNKKVKD